LFLAFIEVIFVSKLTLELLLVTLFGVPAAWLLIRTGSQVMQKIDRGDVFSPLVLFPAAYLVWFTVGSISFLRLPSSISFGLFEAIPGRMWIYYAVGLISYLAGAWIVLQLGPEPRQEGRTWHFFYTWEENRFRLVIGGLAALMLASYIAIISHLGIPLLQGDAYLVRLEIGKYRWAQLFLIASAYTILPFLAAYFWTNPSRGKPRRAFWFLLVLTALLLISLGGRGFIFQPLLTAVVARHYLKNKYRVLGAGTALVVMFAAMSFYGFARDLGGSDTESPFVQAGFPSYLFPFAYSYLYVRYSVATLRDVVSVIPSQVPYQHGWLTFQPLQVLLPGHHDTSDTYFKSILGNQFEGAGQPATLLGPFYGDFGLVGIIVGMLAFGALSMAVYRWSLRRQTVTSALVYAWLVRTAILSLFLSIFEFPTDLWIPLMWLFMDRFLRGARNAQNVLQHPAITLGINSA